MPNPAIAFFPWVYIDEPKTIGPVRLLPYREKQLPGDLSHVIQTDIDGVLGAYADRPNRPVGRGILMELGEWYSGQDAEHHVTELFRVRNLVAFSALAERTLFRQHFGYCNYDTYSLIVQRYKPGDPGTFSFDTRRRDGRTSQLWGADEFAFHRPLHVAGNSRLSLDEPLLTSLLSLPLEHRVYEALLEFNCANTDSRDVPEHVEVVMCKSALEWLLGINSNARSLVDALELALPSGEALPAEGPMCSKWKARWPDETRPLHAWAKDFCAVRGTSAHGQIRGRSHLVWENHQHLAFLALFFPLLVKKVLSDEGLLKLEDFDVEQLKRIDGFLAHDPFDFNWRSPDAVHPWDEATSAARIAVMARKLYSRLA